RGAGRDHGGRTAHARAPARHGVRDRRRARLRAAEPAIGPAQYRACAGAAARHRGGLLLAVSPALTFAVCALLWLTAAAVMLGVAVTQAFAEREPLDLKTLFSGFVFIGRNKAVLGAITLDLFAVLLGSTTALLPVFASDIFPTGPLGFGA